MSVAGPSTSTLEHVATSAAVHTTNTTSAPPAVATTPPGTSKPTKPVTTAPNTTEPNEPVTTSPNTTHISVVSGSPTAPKEVPTDDVSEETQSSRAVFLILAVIGQCTTRHSAA